MKTWKPYLIVSISLVLLLPLEQWVQACGGWDDPYDEYPQYFQNNMTANKAYRPFRYVPYELFYWEEEPVDSLADDANITEWKQFSDGEAGAADINRFVCWYDYNTLRNLYYHIEKDSLLLLPAGARDNSFTKWFLKSRNLEALGYLMYAKQCEPFAKAEEGARNEDTYEWTVVPRDTVKMGKLIRNGLQLHRAARDRFIRGRYAYQVLRMAFYSYRYTQTLELYDRLMGDHTGKGLIYARCLALKAGALYKLGRKPEAAYYYSLAFDASDEQKYSSYLSFKWATGGDITEALHLAQNDHERAVLYVMSGLHQYNEVYNGYTTLMEQAYALDSQVEGLDVLMTRAINTVEDVYMSNSFPADPLKTGAYLESLNTFAQKMVLEGRNGRRAFWELASAYLYYLAEEPERSRERLAKAKGAGMNIEEQATHDILQALIIIGKEQGITAEMEERLLPLLSNMQEAAKKEERYGRVGRNIMLRLLVPAYLKQGDTTRAILSYVKAARMRQGLGYISPEFQDEPGAFLDYMDVQSLKRFQEYLVQGKKTAFEQWLLAEKPYSRERLKELEATKYVRLRRWDDAIALLEQLPDTVVHRTYRFWYSGGTYTEGFLPDPFVSHLKEMQDLEQEDTLQWYSTLSFAKRMGDLERTLLHRPEYAKGAFDYALGLYGMSYYGKAHHAFDYFRSSTDGNAYYAGAGRQELKPEWREYYELRLAEQYFLRAYEQARDPELKAKALYMASRCWQKRAPERTSGDQNQDPYYAHSLQSPYFRTLKEGYSQTSFFKAAATSCSYLRDYLKKQ